MNVVALLLGQILSLMALHADRRVPPPDLPKLVLTARTVKLASGRTMTLKLPREYEITVAAEGMKRLRFLAEAPDGRIFATDMHDRTDNSKGAVYILDNFDSTSGRFLSRTTWLDGLRNPNSLAFGADSSGGHWLYLALTQALLRYRFTPGETKPSAAPDTLVTFPDYGLSYKYGGWHLTRTVVVGGDGRVYVAVGSSCNACEEKEEVRASLISMRPDGSDLRTVARGLRNAVGLVWARGNLYGTNMGSDHLGDDKPEDQFIALPATATTTPAEFGWPYWYQYRGRMLSDPQFASSSRRPAQSQLTLGLAGFGAHSAPLGVEYIPEGSDPALGGTFLVALHGASKRTLGRGYRIVQVTPEGKIQDFLTGFLVANRLVDGRPCGILRYRGGILVTDDQSGVLFYLRRK